jgi:hypothetical protein
MQLPCMRSRQKPAATTPHILSKSVLEPDVPFALRLQGILISEWTQV